MTLDEKIGQMTVRRTDDAATRRAQLGSILSGGGGYPDPNTPQAYDMATRISRRARTPPGIPIIYGVTPCTGTTSRGRRPSSADVGMGATNDPARSAGPASATALEIDAPPESDGDFGPVVAVPQDIRWGAVSRATREYDLVSRLGTACIIGLRVQP